MSKHARHPPNAFVQHAMVALDLIVDGSLVGLIAVAPLFMGGRGAVGQLVFVLLACLAAIAWSARQTLAGGGEWRWSGAEWLLTLGALVVVLQLVPLSQDLLFQLSPAIKDLLPMWSLNSNGAPRLGEWSTLSLSPDLTRGGLTIYLSYALVFVVLIQRLDTVEDIGKLFKWIGVAAVVMSVIGLAQFFSGTTKFLWVYEHPTRSACKVVRAAFHNENHLAHFLALALGPLLWWMRQGHRMKWAGRSRSQESKVSRDSRDRPVETASVQPFVLLGMVVVALAGLLTFSRGGVLTMAIAVVACVIVLYWKSLLDRKTTWVLSAAAAVNLLALLLFGYEPLTHQLGTVFQANSFDELFSTRMDLWSAMCDGISQFYLTGAGVGTHSEIYRTYMEEWYNAEFTHGESGYLPLLLETGLVGLALMLAGIGISFYWCVRALWRLVPADSEPGSSGLAICAAAVVPSLVASVVHSIADFVWYIPACMTLTVAQVACACRIHQLAALTQVENSRTERHSARVKTGGFVRMPRGACAAMTVILMMAGWALVANRLGPALAAPAWNSYLCISLRGSEETLSSLEKSQRFAGMQRHLESVVRHSPRDAEAQLRLAAVYLKQFELAQRTAENSMDLSQIRDAALASAFPSKAAQDAWLNVALGESRKLLDLAQEHSRQAVALSPLQGLGYAQLADLSFLESPRAESKDAYIAQAALVRPHSGPVLFIQGREASLVGDLEGAFAFWKRAFRQDPEVRHLLVESLADRLPADIFLQKFEPDTRVLGQLFERYKSQQRVEEAKWVGPRYIAGLQRDADGKPVKQAAACWNLAQDAALWLGQPAEALRFQQRAVELAPQEFNYRVTLANLLVQEKRFEQAVSELEWCLRRQPERQDLRAILADARLEHRHGSHSAPVAARPAAPRR